MNNFDDFLKNIYDLASDFPSIFEGGKLCSLSLNFWNWVEIQKGIENRSNWDVNENYVPFYGDWHDLYCIDILTGKVAYITDDRTVKCEWEDTQKFISSLSNEEIKSTGVSGIVSGRLDF